MVQLEKIVQAPIHLVWKAITDKNEMKQWYFDLAEFIPQVGFEFKFKGGHEDGVQYLHVCEITEVIIGKKLTYSWRYDGYEGISYVSFELFEEGANTKLKLTHTGLETFPATNKDFAEENFVTGWNHFINISLIEFLNKKENVTE